MNSMKSYIMILFIILHLFSTTLSALDSLTQLSSINHKQHECSTHHNSVFSHEHFHHTTKHSHSHSHQTIINVDFFVYTDEDYFSSHYSNSQKYLEKSYFISDPTSKSLLRPPIV